MKTQLRKIIGSLLIMALFLSFIPAKVFAEAAVQLQALFVDQNYTYVDLYGLTNEGIGIVGKDNKYGFIDNAGQVIIPIQYESTSGFSNGLAAVMQNKKYGYINTKGEVVVEGKYTRAERFKDGFARVALSENGKYGYINTEGKEVIPPIYSNITSLVNGYAAASIYNSTTKEIKFYLVNTSGLQKEIDADTLDIIEGKYLKVGKDKGYIYYDFEGNLLNFNNSVNSKISNGLMLVSKDGKYGFIDEKGNEVIPADYISVGPFDNNGIAIVAKEKDNYFGIDKAGNIVIKPDNYKSLRLYSMKKENKYYLITKQDENGKIKTGCLDSNGNVIVPAVYDGIGASGASNDLMVVINNRQSGFSDIKGNLTIPTNYEQARSFSNGLAAVRKDGKWGFIDTKGNTVIPFQYDNVSDGFTNSLVAVEKDGKAGIIDTAGNTVIPFDFKTVRDFEIKPEGYILTVTYDGEKVYKKNERYSLYAINKTASPTQSAVLVNGNKVPFEAFNIDSSNYFKLRDIAKVLNGTGKQFEIGWDDSANSITISTGKAYTEAGGELAVSGNTDNKSASITNSKILVNGKEIKLTAYQINGSNYFKLRDLAESIDFGITWDESTSTIGIDTASGYSK